MMPLLAIEILIAIGAFALLFAAMAIGVIFRRQPLQGSCGGLNKLSLEVGKSLCEVCTEPCAELKRELRRKGMTEEQIAAMVPPSDHCEHHDDPQG